MSKKLLVICYEVKNQWSITKFNNLPANLKGEREILNIPTKN